MVYPCNFVGLFFSPLLTQHSHLSSPYSASAAKSSMKLNQSTYPPTSSFYHLSTYTALHSAGWLREPSPCTYYAVGS